MSSYNYYGSHGHATPPSAAPVPHSNHGGRGRRQPGRLSVGSQNSQKHYRASPRTLKELAESHTYAVARTRFEATRSFDVEDDMEFCPTLCSQIDFDAVSIASSERSSLASSSPESSPTQQPQTVAPAFSLNSSSPPFIPPIFPSHTAKLHQPAATRVPRTANAIPIINPYSNNPVQVHSPPPSVSPSRMHQIGRTGW